MTDYIYTAVTKDGKKVKGTISANTQSRAMAMLREQGLVPTKVEQQTLLNKDINISIGNPVKPRDLSVFCRQFQSILAAGVTIVEALGMLVDQTENKVFAKAIKETQTAVQKGSTLAEAMKASPKIYPAILINMVEAGEASGSLELAMERMSVQFEKSAKLKALVKKALMYPIVIIIVAIGVLIAMSILVIPQFAKMFAGMGSELPGITKAVMAFSDFLMHKWYLLILIVAVVGIAVTAFAKTEAGQVVFGTIAIKAPIFGKLSVKTASASFARTISTLMGAGIPLSEALDITSRSMKNIHFKRALQAAKKEVEQGTNLSEPLRRSGLFPMMIPQMIKIGEETGNIDGMLIKAADYYEDEVEIATGSLTTLMEPLIIVVLGAIVAVLVLAMYMPMIDMYGGMENL
ncbi:MAG: type II secretion system F family protein [Lachnospiraceae bacterium]|nr:type II secretion system F family protein [Lachnospiraceae bacterium]